MSDNHARAYWKANVRLLCSLLGIWFFISYVCGILLADVLDNVRFGGFKLGFWIAQQGSIYVFVVLIFVYIVMMDRLDRKYRSDRDASNNAEEESR